MSKINIITYPDVLHNNALNIVLIYPEKNILDHLQSEFLTDYNNDVNLYLFDRLVQDNDEIGLVSLINQYTNILAVIIFMI